MQRKTGGGGNKDRDLRFADHLMKYLRDMTIYENFISLNVSRTKVNNGVVDGHNESFQH